MVLFTCVHKGGLPSWHDFSFEPVNTDHAAADDATIIVINMRTRQKKCTSSLRFFFCLHMFLLSGHFSCIGLGHIYKNTGKGACMSASIIILLKIYLFYSYLLCYCIFHKTVGMTMTAKKLVKSRNVHPCPCLLSTAFRSLRQAYLLLLLDDTCIITCGRKSATTKKDGEGRDEKWREQAWCDDRLQENDDFALMICLHLSLWLLHDIYERQVCTHIF